MKIPLPKTPLLTTKYQRREFDPLRLEWGLSFGRRQHIRTAKQSGKMGNAPKATDLFGSEEKFRINVLPSPIPSETFSKSS